MKCVKVISAGSGTTFACNQCMPCRINKRREWTFRLLMESRSHPDAFFVTLTYDDEHLPTRYTSDFGSVVTLDPEDVRLWRMRFRTALGRPFRYYTVGEYGDQTQRPHYHAAIFGNFSGVDLPHLIEKTWGKGFIDVSPLIQERAQYLAGYVTKKMTKASDPRLYGRFPEFSRMSLKPGIGALAMQAVGDTLLTNKWASDFLEQEGDVPSVLRTAGRSLPIGRYLRSRLQNEVGFDQSVSGKLRRESSRLSREREEMLSMWESSASLAQFFKEKGFVASPAEARQKLANLKARQSINKRRKI